MSEDKMLKCLIFFVLGYLVHRMMEGNGLSVGAEEDTKCESHSDCGCKTKTCLKWGEITTPTAVDTELCINNVCGNCPRNCDSNGNCEQSIPYKIKRKKKEKEKKPSRPPSPAGPPPLPSPSPLPPSQLQSPI